MTTDVLIIRDEPPANPRRSGCLVSGLVFGGLVGLTTLLLLPAVNNARQAARMSQFT